MKLFRKVVSSLTAPDGASEQRGSPSIIARKRSRPTVSPKCVSHGLFVLHPPPELYSSDGPWSVDIVAVHGLNGQARNTWKDEASGMLWLEDFLPDVLPDARIMTFGYDSSLLLSQSKGRIEDFARDLLNRLWMVRQSPGGAKRPIVFVAHSLGGIVVKKAIILAHEDGRHYQDIVSSTAGVVFMGTPHRGSGIVDWTSFLRNAVQLVSGTGIIRTDLLRDLSAHSTTLLEISKSFLPRTLDLAIMSFIETQCEPPLTALVVPRESARLGLPNEMVFPVNTHHRNICRYPSSKDQTYVLVESSIKSIVSGGSELPPKEIVAKQAAQVSEAVQRPANIVQLHRSLEESQKTRKPPASLTTTKNENLIKLRIRGLRPKITETELGWSEGEKILHIPGDTPVRDLQSILAAEAPDVSTPQALKFHGRDFPITRRYLDCFTMPVEVTSGRSCYTESPGYKINIHQSIADFFTRLFPLPLTAEMREYPEWMQDTTGSSSSVIIRQDPSSLLEISFMRTVRIQGNGNTHIPPTGLGMFPLFDTQDYRDDLPTETASEGGLFLPMYEREAMFLAFDSPPGSNFSIKPFLGGVNAISGEKLLSAESAELSGHASSEAQKQDYIVVPQQKRLDGVSVAPGVVRQFIATKTNPGAKQDPDLAAQPGMEGKAGAEMPINSTNEPPGTFEWQKTGKDEVGGIQLQIIPQFKTKRMFAGSVRDVSPGRAAESLRSYQPVPDMATIYDVLKTPQDLGLHPNDFIFLKNLDRMEDEAEGEDQDSHLAENDVLAWMTGKEPPPKEEGREKVIADLKPESPALSDTLELEVFRNPSLTRILSVNVRDSDEAPARFKVDCDDSFPDILAAARAIFQMPNGELHIPRLVANDQSMMVAVTSWEQFFFLTEMAYDEIEFEGPREYKHDARYTSQISKPQELELVLMIPIASKRRLCHVNFLNEGRERFKDIDAPLILQLRNTTTAADVRQLVEDMTGKSSSGLRIQGDNNGDLHSLANIFRSGIKIPQMQQPIVAIAFNGGMCLAIHTLTGKSLKIGVRPGDLIEAGKKIVERIEGIPVDAQRWIAKGKLLEDERTFRDYDIEEDSTIHLIRRLRGGGSPRNTKVSLAGAIVFDDLVRDVRHLKDEVFRRLGILAIRQNYSLPDDFVLGHEDVVLELQILPPECVTLGIGAGVGIAQEIHADTSDSRMWDVASARILRVHIVNSNGFKSITGMPAPTTPISWKDYKKLGLPYDKAWDREDGKWKGTGSQQAARTLPSVDGTKDGSEPGLDGIRSHPLVLLEADQTVPWFKGLGSGPAEKDGRLGGVD